MALKDWHHVVIQLIKYIDDSHLLLREERQVKVGVLSPGSTSLLERIMFVTRIKKGFASNQNT